MKIYKKTYWNFLQVCEFLKTVKHYDQSTAEKLTNYIFENVENDANRLRRDAWHFANLILSKEEYEKEYGDGKQ